MSKKEKHKNPPRSSVKETAQVRAQITDDDATQDDGFRILQAIRRVIRAVDIHSRQLFTKTRLTSAQLLSLIIVSEKGPLTSVELGKWVHLSPSTIVGILDRLEGKGYITRVRDTVDRRKVHIEATPEGRRVIEISPTPLQDKLAVSLSKLAATERATLAASLERIVELMEAGEIDAAPILDTGPIDRE